MANGTIITNNGLKIVLNRAFKALPDYLAPSVFKVGTGTATPAVTDTDLGTAVTIDADNIKNFATGYPILDETNMQVTFRCELLSTEANGNSLTEFGVFNEDTTELMFSRAVHTAISKTSSVEVSYIEKDKIQ